MNLIPHFSPRHHYVNIFRLESAAVCHKLDDRRHDMRLNSKVSLKRGAYARETFGSWHMIRTQIRETKKQGQPRAEEQQERLPDPA